MSNGITLKEVKEKLGWMDSVGKKKNGNFVVRQGFFYKMGKTIDRYIEAVKAEFPNAKIIDSGEVWKPFRGGASLANQSHFFVEFKLEENNE